MAEQSLKDKTVKGTIWSAADAFLGQGVTFLVGLVLARLLTPEEYGLIGIVAIFTTILLGFVDSGVNNALIRKQEVTNDDYNTMFIVNMVIGLLLFLILYISAPPIAQFFNRSQLISLLRIMGLLLVFQALSIVQMTILSRSIDFKTKTKASFISAASSGSIGIVMAFCGFGVWSLVAQILSRQLFYSLLLWIYIHWRPRLQFNVESFNYMWGFGWKLMLSGFLDRVWTQLYQMVVGKFYSPATLGQYSRSKEYASIFSSNLTSIVQRVSYPVLALVQNDKERMITDYRKIIKVTMFVTAITMISMGAVAEPLIYCLIGPQWQMAASFLPLICISMSLYPLHSINLNMLQIQGRTDIFLYIEIIKKVISVGPICLGVFVGIYWMLIGSIITGIISFFLNSYYTGKSLGYTSWMQLRDVAPSFGIALGIAFAVYFLKYIPISYWIILPVQIIVGIVLFFFICKTTNNQEYLELKNIVHGYAQKLKR